MVQGLYGHSNQNSVFFCLTVLSFSRSSFLSCSNMAAPVPPAPFSLHSISKKKEFHIVFAFLSYEPELTHMTQLQRTLGGEYFSWVSCPGKKSIPLKKRRAYIGSLSSSIHASPWGGAGGLWGWAQWLWVTHGSPHSPLPGEHDHATSHSLDRCQAEVLSTLVRVIAFSLASSPWVRESSTWEQRGLSHSCPPGPWGRKRELKPPRDGPKPGKPRPSWEPGQGVGSGTFYHLGKDSEVR